MQQLLRRIYIYNIDVGGYFESKVLAEGVILWIIVPK